MPITLQKDASLAPAEGGYQVFRSSNEKIAKLLRWSHHHGDDDNKECDAEEIRRLALSKGGLFNGKSFVSRLMYGSCQRRRVSHEWMYHFCLL